MVEIELSTYLNVDTCEQGDIVEIIGEGEYSTMKDNRTQKDKRVFNIPVRLGTKQLTYTPGVNVLKELVLKWGKDSKSWVGKKFQVEIRTVEAFGKETQVIRPSFLN